MVMAFFLFNPEIVSFGKQLLSESGFLLLVIKKRD
jgi:hypothetical protein